MPPGAILRWHSITPLPRAARITCKKRSAFYWTNGKTPETVCGIVRNIGREGQEKRVLTLAELEKTQVDMFTTVFIGNAATRELAGRMVTPRGYKR